MFDLSFSPEFFLAEGEPFDRSDLALNSEGQPTSVYSALALMKRDSPDAWAEMVRDCINPSINPEWLEPENIIETIQTTNTCTNLSTPVEVWIDSKGDHRIKVYQ